MSTPEGKRGPNRSGATALELLAAPLNIQILRALESEPLSSVPLRKAIGSPPQSTMRLYLTTLTDIGAVERSGKKEFQGSTEYALTVTGRALAGLCEPLQVWLRAAPEGPIDLGTPAARNAVKALADGWSSNIVRAVAARSVSLTEMSRLMPKLGYPSLERRLTAMRMVGLIEVDKPDGRSTPYRASRWLCESVGLLILAAEWEREHIPDLTPPIGRLDVEAAFLLAVPLLELEPDVTGKVRLAVEVQRGVSPVFAGVLICVEEGEVTSCTPGLEGEAEAWVSGAPRSWLRRMNQGEKDHIEVGGEGEVARAVLEGLQRTAEKTREF